MVGEMVKISFSDTLHIQYMGSFRSPTLAPAGTDWEGSRIMGNKGQGPFCPFRICAQGGPSDWKIPEQIARRPRAVALKIELIEKIEFGRPNSAMRLLHLCSELIQQRHELSCPLKLSSC